MQQNVLPADYYLTNFRQLTDFVVSRYAHLLGEDALAFYQALTSLPEDTQKLYVRMLLRKGQYFRRSKLGYDEITSVDVALTALAEGGFVTVDAPAPDVALVKLFTKAELVACFADASLKPLSRAELDESLLQRPIREVCDQLLAFAQRQDGEQLIQLCRDEHFVVFRLLFFGNLHQDMTDFVLRDLGLNRYESYPLDADSAALQTPDQVAAHLLYYHYYEQAENIDDNCAEDIICMLRSLVSELMAATKSDSVLRRRVHRLLLKYARQLERLQATQAALEIYQQVDRPPSRERQARLMAEQHRFVEALALCEQILQDSTNEEEQEFAEAFAARCLKKAARSGCDTSNLMASHALQRARLNVAKYTPPTELLALSGADTSVEECVAAHFRSHGACFFVENTLMNAVFGLALWEVIFAPVQGAFYHPFQIGPADLYEDFASNRQGLLQRFWQEISDSDSLSAKVLATFRTKSGIANPFVHWPALDEALLTLALARIPYAHWEAVLKRMLLDIRHHRSGFPDLIWFPDSGGYELLEVKAPGDKVQQNQRRWMAYFDRHHIPHRLVNVQWL